MSRFTTIRFTAIGATALMACLLVTSGAPARARRPRADDTALSMPTYRTG